MVNASPFAVYRAIGRLYTCIYVYNVFWILYFLGYDAAFTVACPVPVV